MTRTAGTSRSQGFSTWCRFLFSLLLLLLLPVASGKRLPYTLGVRDSFMIAHSFHNHPSFGPAGGMHGATYTCDVEFSCARLDKDTNWVMDIGVATEMLQEVLAKYNLQNLDEIFSDGQLTTTEFMAQQIHGDLRELLKQKCRDFRGEICVKLWESHKAWASYSGSV